MKRTLFSLIYLTVAILTASTAYSETPPIFDAKWGTRGSGGGQFQFPRGVAVDAAGNVYVADTNNNQVQKFDSLGVFLSKWGAPGSGDGQFSGPRGIAVDVAGNVYVVDQLNHRIQKFTSTGTFLTKWGSPGTGNGQFSGATGVVADGFGNVYVTDTGNDRVQKFTTNGTYLAQFGSSGSGDGQFSQVWGIDVGTNGDIFTTEIGNDRVQRFDSTGSFITKWGTPGSGDGQFANPNGLDVDASGNVYVVDELNHRVQKFDGSGTFLTKWGTVGSGDGQLSFPTDVAMFGGSSVFVADASNHRVQKFDGTGTFITKWGTQGAGEGQFEFPRGIAVDAAHNVYVVDTNNNRVQKFDSLGVFITKWGSLGSGDGQLSSPRGITVDVAGDVYVVDPNNHRVQKFSGTGTFLTKWGSIGSGVGQFSSPRDVALDGFGNIYVTDRGNNRVQKFTTNGSYLAQFGTLGSGDGQFDGLQKLGVGANGDVYTTETGNNRVQHFDSTGTFIAKWGTSGSGDGQFAGPDGIEVDGSGNVYVVDGGNHRVQKFDGGGAFLSKWGTVGSGDGQFLFPADVATFGDSDVFIVEASGHRIQRFIYQRDLFISSLVSPTESRNGCEPMTVSVTVANAGPSDAGPFDVAIRLSGDSIVTASDALLGSINVAVVPAGGDSTVNLSVTLPADAPRGNVFLGAIADDPGNVTETDETNNTAFNAFTFAPPRIESVRDIPGDQGGQVYLAWWASPLDDPAQLGLITEYSLWRAISAAAASSMIESGNAILIKPFDALPKTASTILRAQSASACGTFFWELIGFQSAFFIPTYAKTVATLFDSTSVSQESHYFQVIAHTTDPLVFYISNPDSGRSVDNLAPGAPQSVITVQEFTPEGLTLSWAPNVEADLSHYAIYRGADPAFVPGPANLVAAPPDTVFFDSDWRWDNRYYYKLSALDTHENESAFAATDPNEVTGVDDLPPPRAHYLEQNYPNPFNPTTTIDFGLAEQGDVRLEIFDAKGRLVRTLVREKRHHNRYSVTWDGMNNAGNPVASGVYLYRLKTRSFTQTRKMLLLK